MKQKNIKVVYKSRSIGGSYTQVPKIQMEGRWLEELGFSAGRIAVERNGEIVPRNRYGETLLADGDVLEIVSFVGGG